MEVIGEREPFGAATYMCGGVVLIAGRSRGRSNASKHIAIKLVSYYLLLLISYQYVAGSVKWHIALKREAGTYDDHHRIASAGQQQKMHSIMTGYNGRRRGRGTD